MSFQIISNKTTNRDGSISFVERADLPFDQAQDQLTQLVGDRCDGAYQFDGYKITDTNSGRVIYEHGDQSATIGDRVYQIVEAD